MTDNPVPAQFNLVTKNMEAAVAFYRPLGISIVVRPGAGEDEECFGAVRTEVASVDLSTRKIDRPWDGAGLEQFGASNIKQDKS